MLQLPEGIHPNAVTAAQVTVLHPNDTGFELNQVTVMYIPPHFVRSIRVSYAGRKVFDAELDFSVSENPTLGLEVQGEGETELWLRDNNGNEFEAAL